MTAAVTALSQKVTNLGGATDGFIRSITRGYDTLGRVTKITSHGNQTDDPNNTSDIKNQIVLTYGNLGHVTRSEQSHAGAVTGSTPEVNYLYDSSNSGGVLIDGYRPLTMTYPDGRVLYYDGGANNSLEDRLLTPKRLRETNSSGTILAEYSNTGLGNTVITDYQVPDVKLDLFGGTTSTYAGLDRFGRTVDHRWYSYASGTVDVARFLHGYDENSNRLYRDDPVAAAATVNLDELYAFDGLDRLTSVDRGNLTTGNTVIASKVFGQDYGLDQLNNWPAFNEDTDGNGTDDITQTRGHNDANEIADIDSASTYVAHDAAGNMTKAPQPGVWNAASDLTWDAWNRLVKVADGGNTVVAYEYDGEHRRVEKTLYKGGEPADTVHYYLSQQNQVLETRLNAETTANRQFTWGPRYVDDLVLRTRDFGKEGVESLYALQDAGWNIVALADASGTIQERFKYDPYGRSTVLDPSFANDSDGASDFDWEYRFTSREFDAETKLSYFRARYWHDGLGRFLGRDPLEYIDGGSLYAGYFVPGGTDPDGLSWISWMPVFGTFECFASSTPGSSLSDYDEVKGVKCCGNIDAQGIAIRECINEIDKIALRHKFKALAGYSNHLAVDVIGLAISAVVAAYGGIAPGAIAGLLFAVDGVATAICIVKKAGYIADAAKEAKMRCACR